VRQLDLSRRHRLAHDQPPRLPNSERRQ
jgi:hypothetical protein